MTVRAVSFRRDWAGEAINLWIYHPGNVVEKLVFTQQTASSSLQEGAQYSLFWIAVGAAGSALKVERLVHGVDSDFSSLVEKWELPAGPHDPPGKIITYQDFVEFKI